MPANTQMPLIELDLLKTIVAIAETGNFSAAADAVFRTPSAISMQVKRIEELLGRPIFVRAPRRVTLNEDGEILVAHARRVLALNADTVAKFVSPEMSGIVRLGAIDHAADRILPGLLRDFSRSHPQIRVDVWVENSIPLQRAIRQGELDIALATCHSVDKNDLDIEMLMREQLVWAGLKGGIAAEQEPLPVSVWEEGCIWRENALDGLDKQNRDYCITFKSAHLAGQKAGIRADLAIAPLPLSACDDEIIPIGNSFNLPPLDEYAIGMIVRKNAEQHVQAVADTLRAYAQTFDWRGSVAA